MKRGLIIGTVPTIFGGEMPGGISSHIGNLINELVKKDYHIDLCYHKPHKYYSESNVNILGCNILMFIYNIVKGLSFLILKSPKTLISLHFKEAIIMSYYYGILSSYFKNNNVDFIHVHSLTNVSTTVLKILNIDTNIIVSDHGFWQNPNIDNDTKYLYQLRENFDSATKVIYISDYAYQYHLKYKLGDLSKLVKISNPIDFELFKPNLYKETSQKKIIFFNGLTYSLRIKRLDVLLKSIQTDVNLRESVALNVICDEEGQKYINSQKWDFEINTFGRLPIKEVLELYNLSDLMVLPSKSESFGLVYLEALAMGIPVVGFEKVIDEFQLNLNMYIGESYNSKKESYNELSYKINKALNTPFDSDNVRKKLIEKYSWSNNICQYISIYN